MTAKDLRALKIELIGEALYSLYEYVQWDGANDKVNSALTSLTEAHKELQKRPRKRILRRKRGGK